MPFSRQDNMGGYPNAPPSWGSYNPPPQGPYYQQQLPPGLYNILCFRLYVVQ